MEGLFDDDFEDEIVSTDNINNDIANKIIMDEDKPKIKQWLLDNILCKYGDPFKCEEDKDIMFFMDYGELYCDLKFNCYSVTFLNEIPDYIKINKINGGTIIFNSYVNLPKEISGTLFITDYKLKDFSKIEFPEKIDQLNLVDCKIRSLKGLNNTCKHITQLTLERCNMFKSFEGIPDEVNSMKLHTCNKIENLIGIPESIDFMELIQLKTFNSLEGCPKKLKDGLYILECPSLSTLTHIAKLIIGDVEISSCSLYQLDMKGCRITGNFKLSDNHLYDLQNGPSQIDGSYIIQDKYLKKLNASETTMTNVYNNARFIYIVKRKYFIDDNTFPQMSDEVKVEKEYL